MKNYLEMRRIFTLVSYFLVPITMFGQDIQALAEHPISAEDSFNEAFNACDFELGERFIDSFNENDTLGIVTILNAADCLTNLKKFDKAISFCRKWGPTYPKAFEDGYFDGKIGICYYYLYDNIQADSYLSRFFSWANDAGVSCGIYITGIYANVLHENHKYSEADSLYRRYFDLCFQEDGVNWETLHKGTWRDNYGYKLYYYAYNSLLQGDEAAGKYLLNLAKKCGDEYAEQDFERFNASPTFATPLNLDKSTITSFEKTIALYDIKENVATLNSEVPQDFWDIVVEHSANYRKLVDACNRQRKPKLLQVAMDEINNNEAGMKIYLEWCSPYAPGEFEEALQKDLIGKSNFLNDFRIYPCDGINAFATPYGQIYLTDGLVKRYHFNNVLLLGVCAHEMTHYLCQHSLISKWQQLEKERKSEILGGIAASLYAGAMIASGVAMASNGATLDDSYWDNSLKSSIAIAEAFEAGAYYFKFKYSREQELESDIIAYRFCEAMGIGGYAYILALQLLGDNDFYLKADTTDDHPTTAYRVLMLKYLYAKEHPSY